MYDGYDTIRYGTIRHKNVFFPTRWGRYALKTAGCAAARSPRSARRRRAMAHAQLRAQPARCSEVFYVYVDVYIKLLAA